MGKLMGLAPQRQLPAFARRPFRRWWKTHQSLERPAQTVWLYVDPFTEYTEPEIAIGAVRVLESMNIGVEVFGIADDGRTYLSKGLVRDARDLMSSELASVREMLAEHPERPVIGLEPSALLTFRDEMPDLVEPWLRDTAKDLAQRSFLIDEWLDRELTEGRIADPPFAGSGDLVFHGHCHQKAMIGVGPTERVLARAGYSVRTLPTGCCGMAGSFGYEKEHYELSMQVGELVLFPALRALDKDALIVAPGTSCRHQIADGVSRSSVHPVIALERALLG
jgi:Fe-S oxidoreductase